MESAPPTAAAKQAMVERNMLVSGSSALIIRHDVSAWMVPGVGSGSLEALTDALCGAAWEEFQRIEAEGGILTSLVENRIQQRIGAAREARAALYADGGRSIVGTSVYALKQERPVKVLDAQRRAGPMDGVVFCDALEATRIDQLPGVAP